MLRTTDQQGISRGENLGEIFSHVDLFHQYIYQKALIKTQQKNGEQIRTFFLRFPRYMPGLVPIDFMFYFVYIAQLCITTCFFTNFLNIILIQKKPHMYFYFHFAVVNTNKTINAI
jgi:hypothetical protein